jgi:hypothetical protein
MTIGDANDINHVLEYMLGTSVGEGITGEQARESAVRLAERASKALSAGITGNNVRRLWPRYERIRKI